MNALLVAALVHAAAATVLAAGAGLAGLWIRRPALIHTLWILVLLKLVTPAPLSLPVLPRLDAGPVAAVASSPTPRRLGLPAARSREPMRISSPAEAGLAVAAPTPAPAPVPVPARRPSPSFSQIAVAIWLAGSFTVLWLAATRWRRFRRLLAGAAPADDEIVRDTRRLAERVGLSRPPRVRTVQAAITPMVCPRLGRTELLLPAGLLQSLTRSERDALLTHELAHLRRRDHWVRWLELTAAALFWWHPVLPWARAQLRRAEEQCCDAWVVHALPGHARSYARALVKTLEFLAGKPVALPALASGVGEVRHLKERLTMILEPRSSAFLSSRQRATLAALAATLLLFVPGWAEPKKDAPTSEELAAAEADYRSDVLELEQMAAELEQQLEELRTQQMELEFRWMKVQREHEMARIEAEAEQLEAEGDFERAAELRSEQGRMEREFELHARSLDLRREVLQRTRTIEGPLRDTLTRVEKLEAEGRHEEAAELRAEAMALQAELQAVDRDTRLRHEELEQAMVAAETDLLRSEVERLRKAGDTEEAHRLETEIRQTLERQARQDGDRARAAHAEAIQQRIRELENQAAQLEAEGDASRAEELRRRIEDLERDQVR